MIREVNSGSLVEQSEEGIPNQEITLDTKRYVMAVVLLFIIGNALAKPEKVSRQTRGCLKL